MAGLALRSLSVALAFSGAKICLNPSRLASIHRGRSTTRTGEAAGGATSPVTSVTYASARTAASRSSATVAAAPLRVISGPGLTSLVAVLSATVQSTIDVAMRRAYALAGRWAVRADPDPALARGRSAAAAGTDRCGDPVQPDPGVEGVLRPVDQEGVDQDGAVAGPDQAGQGMHLAQGAGLASHHA